MAINNHTSKSIVAESEYHLFPELTARQYEALELFSCGVARKQLGGFMGISIDTVNGHVEAVKGKLGCSNSSEIRSVFLSRLMKHLCKRNELENPTQEGELPHFVPKNVRVLPQDTYWNITEKADILRENLQLLEHFSDLPSAVRCVISTCASYSAQIDSTLQDMSAAHAESIECEETFTLNNLIQDQLENDE
ncbi:helix-turn-helix transcriptional regulator [Vibrio atlanticus]|uniref:helix-turn-helix transcriptional regulator n=1 Tax=Vibrio atlanticus TaxID=693153 RepID=UPI00354DB1D8